MSAAVGAKNCGRLALHIAAEGLDISAVVGHGLAFQATPKPHLNMQGTLLDARWLIKFFKLCKVSFEILSHWRLALLFRKGRRRAVDSSIFFVFSQLASGPQPLSYLVGA